MTTGISGSDLHQFNLDLHPNEASGLILADNEALLNEHGWDLAFWAVMDEGPVNECVALIGHRRDADEDLGDGWEIHRLRAVPSPSGDTKQTEDCEALARKDGYVYIVGSHFGSKKGPLEPKRGFIARFQEADVLHATDDPAAEIVVSRPAFAMHRLINDAFVEHGVDLLPLESGIRKPFIDATVGLGKKKKKRWAGLVREGDYPMNIEGATFRPNGNMLIGLRFPTTSDGKPILVEISGIDGIFEPGGATPKVEGFWVLDAVGRNGRIAGVRDLTFVGDELHAQTGDLDSAGKGSLLLENYPGGRGTVSTHWRINMPEDRHSGELKAELVREFPDHPRVEGIAGASDGRFFYVVDEDEGVHLRLTPFLEG